MLLAFTKNWDVTNQHIRDIKWDEFKCISCGKMMTINTFSFCELRSIMSKKKKKKKGVENLCGAMTTIFFLGLNNWYLYNRGDLILLPIFFFWF